MSGNSFGKLFRITTFGESHGKAIGVIADGVPPGIPLCEADIQRELDRRKPGQSSVTTPRKEDDAVEILSGIFGGKTTGTPLALVIFNKDMRSSDYENLKDVFRPGQADFSYHKKYGLRDHRGSGRASGRETAARVAAGALAKRILAQEGIRVIAYTLRAAGILCAHIDESVIEKNPMRAPDMNAAALMEERVKALSDEGDSVGGIVECRIRGAKPGLGEPAFDKLDAVLAHAMLSLGAVKGIEFGTGFGLCDMRGSESNDLMNADGFLSNHAGGILGGISTGEEIVFRIVVKPTASIRREQRTVDTQGNERIIRIEGRHDPCICPRIVPVVEAMSALVMTDFLLQRKAYPPFLSE